MAHIYLIDTHPNTEDSDEKDTVQSLKYQMLQLVNGLNYIGFRIPFYKESTLSQKTQVFLYTFPLLF